MNDILKSKLVLLAEDELTMNAIKAIFDIRLKKAKPDIDKTNDNKILGEKYRAMEEAKKLIEGTLTDISSYKEQRSGDKKLNKER